MKKDEVQEDELIQTCFYMKKAHKKAIDMYCVEKDITIKDYLRKLVEADLKIKKYLGGHHG